MTETTSPMDEQTQLPAPPTQFSGKRHLRHFLLNRIQLRYTAVIVLLSACLTGGLGYLVISKMHEATETARLTVLGSVDDPLMRDHILESFQHTDRTWLIILVGFGLLLC